MGLELDISPYSHMLTLMKTTLELPDALFAEAKAMALRRRTTLKALFTRALERELRGDADTTQQRFQVDESGWPVLRRAKSNTPVVTDQFIQEMRESEGI
jgi:hypothetical protein